jgi:hypothetical protein
MTTAPALEPARATSARRDLALAWVVAAACYASSCAILAPSSALAGFGVDLTMMSAAPFDWPGRLPHRVLAPLLGWAVGAGGANYWRFTQGLGVLLLAMVWLVCRRHGATLLDAALVTLAVAVTSPIQMYKVQWVAYSDALTYTLFFAALLAAKRPVLFWSLFFANLLNHELAAFLLPWLWFVRRQAGGSPRADLVGAGVALALYAAFYLYVRSAAPAQLYSAAYFAQHPMFPGGSFMVLVLAITHAATTFGPVLAVLAWHQHTAAHGRERWHLWLVLGSVLAIFCIAYDWHRHSHLLVLPLVLASVRFLAAGKRLVYGALVAAGIATMLAWPQWNGHGWPMNRMATVDLWDRTGTIAINPATGELTGCSLSAAVTRWFPEVAPYFAGVVAALVAFWLVGFALARGDRAPAVAPIADPAA